jgi:hypothetical protein
MYDLLDISSVKIYPVDLWFNCITGVLAKRQFNTERWEKKLNEIPPPSRWVADALTRQRGIGKVTDAVFDMRLTPVGTAPPIVENETDYKTAVSMLLVSPEHGLVLWTTCSSILVKSIGGLWDQYRLCQEASDGRIPHIQIGTPRPITIGRATQRQFYAPTISPSSAGSTATISNCSGTGRQPCSRPW